MENNKSVEQIMESEGCTFLEASLIFDPNYEEVETVQQAQDYIAKYVTYARLLESLVPGIRDYVRSEELPRMYEAMRKEGLNPGAEPSEYEIKEHTKELVLELAEQFALDWQQTDDYDDMTEEEITSVIYGNLIHERLAAL